MAERAALDVLARQADGGAVFEDRRKRQVLGGGPVDGPLVGAVERDAALVADALQLLVNGEPGGTRVRSAFSARSRSSGTAVLACRATPRGGGSGYCSCRLRVALDGLERLLERRHVLLDHRRRLLRP